MPDTSLQAPESPGRLQRRDREQAEGHWAAGSPKPQPLKRFPALGAHRLHGLAQPGVGRGATSVGPPHTSLAQARSRVGSVCTQPISEAPSLASPRPGVGWGACAHLPLVRTPPNRFTQTKLKHSHRPALLLQGLRGQRCWADGASSCSRPHPAPALPLAEHKLPQGVEAPGVGTHGWRT